MKFDALARILAHDVCISLESKDWKIVNVYGVTDQSHIDGSAIKIPAYVESDTNVESEPTGGIVLVELAPNIHNMSHSIHVKS